MFISIRINKKERRAQAHFFFDSIWRSGLMSRSDAYKWLSYRLGIKTEECHFSVMKGSLITLSIHECVLLLNENRKRTGLPEYVIS